MSLIKDEPVVRSYLHEVSLYVSASIFLFGSAPLLFFVQRSESILGASAVVPHGAWDGRRRLRGSGVTGSPGSFG